MEYVRDTTHIRIKKDTKLFLDKKKDNETYDAYINKLIKQNGK